MPAPAHDTLIVFARHPVAGRVKTRLSPALPPALAASLYNALLADTLAAVAGCGGARRELWWADEASAEALAVAVPAGFAQRQQGAGNLGARLSEASAAALAEPNARVAIIGSDAPALTAAHLDAAFAALDAHDVVLGPASDGGYWLIALRRPAPVLFEGLAWSTSAVLRETRARAERAGLSVALLETLSDLDTPADLARLMGRVAAGSAGVCGATLRAALVRLCIDAAL
jgi:rSAM/selenodomain-associated transferase 1